MSLRLKTKNYRQVAVFEILLIFCVLSIGDLFKFSDAGLSKTIIHLALIFALGFYVLLLLQLSKFLDPGRKTNLILRFGFAGVILLLLIAFNPFFTIGTSNIPWLVSMHVALCLIECYLIALGLMDIYADDLQITERLWGSVAIYLLIALGWASFYEIFVLVNPQILGVTLTPGYQTYSESLYYSLCSISGTGTVYTNPSHLIRNFALIEAVWGVLFLVMLIGRLFSLPAKNE